MKTNGFTLIELLAVIVILAIIALIATPIILGIINDAREESNERSIELYASAIRNGIAAYQLREGKEVAAGSYTSESLPFEVEYDGKVECSTIELYENGGVYVEGCTVNDNSVDYTYGAKQDLPFQVGKLSSVCTPVTTATTGNVPSGAYNIGDEYTCEVKEGVSYTFFVLSKEGNKVNLIMDSNITKDGTPIKEENSTGNAQSAWLNSADFAEAGGKVTNEMLNDEGLCQYTGTCVLNTYGPLSAMNHLQAATSTWTNVNELVVSTFDDESGNIHNMAQTYTTYARLPYISEVIATGCSTFEEGTCPLWMVDYMLFQTNEVPGVYGYWTLSSYASDSLAYYAWIVDYSSGVGGNGITSISGYGVRPVITLSI